VCTKGPQKPLARLDVIPENGEIRPEYEGFHRYPFDSLPLLQSHLHPKFVIYDVGNKLHTLDEPLLEKIVVKFPIMKEIQDLYTSWVAGPLWDEAVKDSTYISLDDEGRDGDDGDDDAGNGDDGDDPIDSDYDDRTVCARLGSQYRKRRAPQTTTAIKRNSVKHKVSKPEPPKVLSELYTPNNQLLSEDALSSFNLLYEETPWTHDSILEWSGNFRKKRKLGGPSFPKASPSPL
jgi:hypothetical protein